MRALVLLALAGCHQASPPVPDRSDGAIPSLRAPKAGAPVVIDGRLDELPWTAAGSTGGLVNPADGRPNPRSRVQAVAHFTWNADFLYVGVVVDDVDPASPYKPTDVDPHIWERASGIELMIQPGDAPDQDNKDYYEVQVDVNGAVWDTHFDDYNQPIVAAPGGGKLFGHQEWNSGVAKAIVVDRAAGHYTVELALPWSAFASSGTHTAVPPKPGDVWRVNVYSFRGGQRDALAWSPLLGKGNFHRAARFGRVTFVE